MAELGFDGSETDLGQDVAGSFLVNGVSEAAIGNGQRLVGNGENENTADLQVRVGLTSSQVQPGADANLTITRGIAARLEQVLNSLFDTGNGRIKAVNDSFDEQVEDIQATIERQTALFDARQEALLAEFIALETAVSQLQSTGSFLSAQLSAFSQLAPR